MSWVRKWALAVFVLSAPTIATAQTWVFDFAADETSLSADGYRAAQEIGARIGARPGMWQADVEVEVALGAAPPDGADVWRLRAVMLELAEQGVLLPRAARSDLVSAETTPANDLAPAPARIVVHVHRLEDDPGRLFHRHDPVIHFASGSAEVSREGRFRLAFHVAGPEVEGARARVRAYADTAGNAEANLRLTEARADNVARELIRLGLPAEWIDTQALGETALVTPSADDVAEASNRRATVTLYWPGPSGR